MCCFSRKVESVSDTQIFARSAGGNRQYLVYQMHMRAKEDLAMILPIPVPKRSKEDAVRFISLKDYPGFFIHMRALFASPKAVGSISRSKAADVPTEAVLPVVEVGDFEASFVPAVADFNRLDERFRLPTDTWDKLPAYKEFGFAVFKLKPKGTGHPMAFEFPRSKPESLFFPTVHIHDGKVHATADFDHRLYCQSSNQDFRNLVHWQESHLLALSHMDLEKSKELVDSDAHCYLKEIRGRQKNEDVVLV